jgi:hypothetical protein
VLLRVGASMGMSFSPSFSWLPFFLSSNIKTGKGEQPNRRQWSGCTTMTQALLLSGMKIACFRNWEQTSESEKAQCLPVCHLYSRVGVSAWLRLDAGEGLSCALWW